MSDDPMGLSIDQAELDLIRDEVVEEHYGHAFLSELEASAPRTTALHRESEADEWGTTESNSVACAICGTIIPGFSLVHWHPGIGYICSDNPDCTGKGVSDWKDVALKAIREWGWLAGQTDSPIFPDAEVESWARITIRNRIAPQASDEEMQAMAEAYMTAYIAVKEGLI